MAFLQAACNGAPFYLHYMLKLGRQHFFVSGFARSAQICKSAGASMATNYIYKVEDQRLGEILGDRGVDFECYRTYLTKEVVGKDSYNHFIAFPATTAFGSKDDTRKNTCSYMCDRDDEPRVLYSLLMEHYKYPLMLEWMPQFIEWFKKNRYFCGETTYVLGDPEMEMPVLYLNDKEVPLDRVVCRHFTINEAEIERCIKELFDGHLISITDECMQAMDVTNLDDYIAKYGTTIIDNLSKVIEPLMENNPNIDSVALKKYRLYPQQICKVNGLEKYFETGAKAAFVIMGCGTGKTIQCASTAESYENKKYMRTHKGATLLDAINYGKYRNIIICPGHLVEKWEHELTTQIPNIKVTVLNTFSQLVELKKRGRARTGREWYIMSKDFAKLSSTQIPVPTKVRKGKLTKLVCSACGADKPDVGRIMCSCGAEKARWVKKRIRREEEGLVCPNCDSILMPYKSLNMEDRLNKELSNPLMPVDFTNMSTLNSRCPICESTNWRPNAQLLDQTTGEYHNMAAKHSKSRWVRVKHYANKTHKATKNVWMLDDYVETYLASIGMEELGRDEDRKGPRKYAPADFIKRQLGKNFFDTLIVDEAHQYKAGGSAQAQAMTSLMCASKRYMLLSGTIIGGYASDLFYLLYRAVPATMKKMGYEWGDVMKFVGKYGVLSTEYEHVDNSNSRWNSSSRGRQLKSPKVRPGVSPLIFLDFLLDKAVFLDLADMSAFMPPLKEKVVTVPIEDEIRHEYKRVVNTLKSASQDGEGMTILSRMLQFSLSYSDKPYGVEEIKSGISGAVLSAPEDLSFLVQDNKMLNKEAKLVEIVKSELAEGRRCLVFCEFTGSPETIITPRIKSLLERECGLSGKVILLEESSPKASKREKYLREQVEKTDAQVILCNPRLIETGIDAVWTDKSGKTYSFSTILFYQMGYSLFTLFQASRRHYRLNQRDECRTYYFASEDTVQPAVIQLMAEKEQAMAALQGSGNFSAESLTSMAASTDSRQKLIQALSSADTHSENELQKMFDVVGESTADNTEVDLTNFTKMLLYSELIGCDAEGNIEQMDGQENLFDFSSDFDVFAPAAEQTKVVVDTILVPEDTTPTQESFIFDKYDVFFQMFEAVKYGTEGPISSKDLKKFKKKNQDQVCLWDLV